MLDVALIQTEIIASVFLPAVSGYLGTGVAIPGEAEKDPLPQSAVRGQPDPG